MSILMLVASTASSAQDDGTLFAGDLSEGTRLHAALETGVGFTDNFFYARDSGNNEQATGLIVRPEALVAHVLPRFKFVGSADAEFAWFDLPGNVDDYTDHQYKIGSEWQPAPRHRFTFEAGMRNDHDPFGTERTENTPLEDRELDRWQQVRTDLDYRLGLPSDRYNVELRASGWRKDYRNNRTVTQYLDHEVVSAQVFAFYNVGPKTSVYGTVAGQHSHYPEIAPGAFDRGANTTRYMLGARWLATAKTSGDARVGYVSRNANDPGRDDYGRLDWLAELKWSPRPVREFRLSTGRRHQESFLNTVDFIDNRFVLASWSEQWTPRLETELGTQYVDSSFVGSSRVDDSLSYSLSGQYALSPYLKLLGIVSSGHRDSDADFANYDRIYAFLGARYAR